MWALVALLLAWCAESPKRDAYAALVRAGIDAASFVECLRVDARGAAYVPYEDAARACCDVRFCESNRTYLSSTRNASFVCRGCDPLRVPPSACCATA